MTDKPIIFSAPMVRALLDGRKTQTRRCCFKDTTHGPKPSTVARYYTPGDRLWVRETFVTGFDIDDEYGRPVGERRAWYRATDSGLTWYDPDTESTLDNPPWRPSIHMPRWASRLTLTVTDVRVQRLQEITAEDCTAEGVPFEADALAPYEWSVSRFADLWNSIHGPDAWAANPWVVALTFTVAKGNIDEVAA